MGLVVSSIDDKERETVRQWHDLKESFAHKLLVRSKRTCFVDLDNISYNPDVFDVVCLRARAQAIKAYLEERGVGGVVVACNRDTAQALAQEGDDMLFGAKPTVVPSKKDAADAFLVHEFVAAMSELESAVLVTMDRSLAKAFYYFATPELREQLTVVGFFEGCATIGDGKLRQPFNFGDSREDLDKFLLLLKNIEDYRNDAAKKAPEYAARKPREDVVVAPRPPERKYDAPPPADYARPPERKPRETDAPPPPVKPERKRNDDGDAA